MELSFFWRSQRLDVLRFDAHAFLENVPSPPLFVSIHAPLRLAREPKPFIEENLRILDDRGHEYGISVEPPTSRAAERYGMINGYVWQRPRVVA